MSSNTRALLAKFKTAESFSWRFGTCQRRVLFAALYSILTSCFKSSISTSDPASPIFKVTVTFSSALKLRLS